MSAPIDPKEIAASASMPDIETLEIIADWRVDLTARIERARLRYELAGLCPDEIMKLAEEAEEFKRVCRGLAWRAE